MELINNKYIMKKNSAIITKATLVLFVIAFGLLSWTDKTYSTSVSTHCAPSEEVHKKLHSLALYNDIDLLYKVDSRFIYRITKKELHQAKSIFDIFPPHEKRKIDYYKNVRVAILGDNEEIYEEGITESFNQKQLDLLHSMDYSTNFYVKAVFQHQNFLAGQVYEDYIVYYTTLIPETKAEYQDGDKSLTNFLKSTTKETASVITKDKLQAGKVNFTINKNGSLENIYLSSTSGYPEVDQKLVEAVSAIPGKWNPAKNEKGEAVNQELVFYFGLEGC